ncbi:MAG: DUF928 domain-containing protein [Alkalinema sp. RL_2_19]|nr:DUF928 domain-containing protein [Alkalinema sp. RL_2_19]
MTIHRLHAPQSLQFLMKTSSIAILTFALPCFSLYGSSVLNAQPPTVRNVISDDLISRVIAPFNPIQRIVFLENFDPPGNGAPPATKGAGSRTNDTCRIDAPPVGSLMPERNYALTVAPRPTVFLHIPPQQPVSQAILTFRDEAHTLHAQVTLPLTAPPTAPPTAPSNATATSIIPLQLPIDSPPLTIGKNYRWSVVLLCGNTPQPDDPILTGWVQRVATPAPTNYAQASLKTAQWHAQMVIGTISSPPSGIKVHRSIRPGSK